MTTMSRKSVCRDERGFALLIVFLLAAAVALTIYQQLPRVAFESAREKEQLVIDRGNQYRRAIEVYYAVNKRYPAKLEDLEKTNEKRFLRRRYIDPLTGKDEWRLVHSNGSALTDSLVEKPPTQNAQNGSMPGGGPLGANNMNTTQAGLAALGQTGSSNNPNDPNAQPPALNPAARQRPSDRIVGQPGAQPGAQSMFPGGFASPNGAPYDPNDPRTWPAITLATPNAAGQNNQQSGQGSQFNGNQQLGGNQQFNPSFQQPIQLTTSPSLGSATNPASFPGTAPFPGGLPGQSGGLGGANPQQLGLTGSNFGGNQTLSQAGMSQNQQPSGFDPNQYPQNTNQNNAPNYNNPNVGGNNAGPPANAVPSPFPTGGANPALALIGNQLSQGTPASTPANTGIGQGTNPFQGNNIFPANNAQGTNLVGGANNPTGTTGGPGIAGVASLFKGPSIKSYKERLKYQEWEFVYKPEDSKGQVAQRPTQQGLGPAGQGPTNQNSMGIGSAFGPSPNGASGPGQNTNGQGQMGNPLGLFGNSPSTQSPQSNPSGVP